MLPTKGTKWFILVKIVMEPVHLAKEKRKERNVAGKRRNPAGMVQSAVMVVNPVPKKKTSAKRRGIRKK